MPEIEQKIENPLADLRVWGFKPGFLACLWLLLALWWPRTFAGFLRNHSSFETHVTYDWSKYHMVINGYVVTQKSRTTLALLIVFFFVLVAFKI